VLSLDARDRRRFIALSNKHALQRRRKTTACGIGRRLRCIRRDRNRASKLKPEIYIRKAKSVSDLVVSKSNSLIILDPSVDPFAVIANIAAPQFLLPGSIRAQFLKDEWTVGQKADALPPGTRCIANMDLYECGWKKWFDKKPLDSIMACIGRGEAPPARAALGDHDQSQWERNDKGEPKDPWTFTHHLPLYDIEAKQLYTYVTSSHGGRGAIGVLCRIFSSGRKKYPDAFPVVELAVGAYNHKEFKRVKVPDLKLVRWVPKADFYAATNLTPEGTLADGGDAAAAAQAEPDAVEDEIPF
jgi:hypothetical protein